MILLDGVYYSDINKAPNHVIFSLINNPSVDQVLRFEDLNLIFWEDHYFELMSLMRISRMDIPIDFTPEKLSNLIINFIKKFYKNEFSFLIFIKIVKSSEVIKKLIFPKSHFLIEVKKVKPIYHYKNKHTIDVYNDFKLCDNPLNNNKFSSSIISLAKVFAFENDFDDSVILDNKKTIVQTSLGYIFLINGNEINTPALNKGFFNNVFYQKLINSIKNNNKFNCMEKDISPFEIQQADEVFIVNIIFGIQSVSSFKKKNYNTNKTIEIFNQFKSYIKEP